MAYCNRCKQTFPHDWAYEQHRSNSHAHWLCNGCDLDFASEDSLDQHYGNSPKHHYCKDCERHFDLVNSKMQHMEAKHWYCETHNRWFGAKKQLKQHNWDVHHICTECSQFFRTTYDARQHANSGVHQQVVPMLRCPSTDCRRTFISPSTLAGHFESRACALCMTWDQLDCLVVCADRKNYMTQHWATGCMWKGATYVLRRD
ncbi:hypothetical protein EDB86DRAFT_2810286 [Lactarius hatsudake]|nr:hypothetical protein EDB86DRAFT_2810286 [Lactarius hatsudake]